MSSAVYGTAGEYGGKIAGGFLGGAIGSIFGPVGTFAGRWVGSKLGGIAGRAAAEALATAMEDANTDAESKTKDQAASTPCKDCGEIDCFTPPEGADMDEFRRQLKEQQDTINNMDPQKLADNIKNYKGRPAGDAAARRQTREDYRQTETRKLSKQYQADGVKDFAEQAAKDVATKMAELNATHTLDLVAGGDGSISGMGDASINKSMGAQWKGGRSKQLQDHAENAAKQGKKMGVTLKECPPKGGKSGTQDGAGTADTPDPGKGDPGPVPTS